MVSPCPSADGWRTVVPSFASFLVPLLVTSLCLMLLLGQEAGNVSPLAIEASESFPDFPGGLLPGTNVTTERARQILEHLNCVANHGRWEYDPHPRPIPWEPEGINDLCDLRWMKAHKDGLMGRAADRVKDPHRWKIREDLKYRWRVTEGKCGEALWEDFDQVKFCTSLARTGGNMLLVGDSLTREMFRAVYNHLGMGQLQGRKAPIVVTPPPCKEWEETQAMEKQHKLCKAAWSCLGPHHGPMIFHARNDRLTLDRLAPREKDLNFYLPWISLMKEWEIKVVVLNRGAHFSEADAFRKELEETLSLLRKEHPDVLILYRATVPGHVDCFNFTVPVERLEEVGAPFGLPYHWGDLHEENHVAQRLVQRFGGIYLDVEYFTTLRPDGHKAFVSDKVDCLHYCAPGPVDTWVQMLYNAMQLLLPP